MRHQRRYAGFVFYAGGLRGDFVFSFLFCVFVPTAANTPACVPSAGIYTLVGRSAPHRKDEDRVSFTEWHTFLSFFHPFFLFPSGSVLAEAASAMRCSLPWWRGPQPPTPRFAASTGNHGQRRRRAFLKRGSSRNGSACGTAHFTYAVPAWLGLALLGCSASARRRGKALLGSAFVG